MPRPKTPVKNKGNRRLTTSARTIGAVDLHFHGAFGIDLMTANAEQMDDLAKRLWQSGVAAICPTTLSVEREEMLEALARIGAWNRSKLDQLKKGQRPEGAIPLGLHLEGPFIHPHACGAHPPGAIRELDFGELDALWEASRQTLKILTIAPETLPEGSIQKLVAWARKRKIVLSLGHSRATQDQAEAAFKAGFTNVTHAWNALPFHQRSPGPLGAAIGNPDVFLELIIDGAHVSETVIRWTLDLHSPERTCFVSDCVTAAGMPENSPEVNFGPLRIRFKDGACRLENGSLAGGGILLPEAYGRWAEKEAKLRKITPEVLLKKTVRSLSEVPLEALGTSPAVVAFLRKFRAVRWEIKGGKPRCQA